MDKRLLYGIGLVAAVAGVYFYMKKKQTKTPARQAPAKTGAGSGSSTKPAAQAKEEVKPTDPSEFSEAEAAARLKIKQDTLLRLAEEAKAAEQASLQPVYIMPLPSPTPEYRGDNTGLAYRGGYVERSSGFYDDNTGKVDAMQPREVFL